MLIYEGSGTAIPPAHSDATVLVASTDIDLEFLTGYLGPFRLAVADALVVMGEPGGRLRRSIAGLAPDLALFRARLDPETTTPVEGRRVVMVTTARPEAGGAISSSLRRQGARSVQTIHTLGDRRLLAADLMNLHRDDLVLTEVKAAAATVVLPLARQVGAEIGFVHNRVEIEGGTATLAGLLEGRWQREPSLEAV